MFTFSDQRMQAKMQNKSWQTFQEQKEIISES
jgi:hypothetical protein